MQENNAVDTKTQEEDSITVFLTAKNVFLAIEKKKIFFLAYL